MAVSRSPGRTRRNASRTLVRDWLPSDRYDAILAVIPLLYAIALAAHLALELPIQVALVPASLVSVALLVDAVYLHPPTADGRLETDDGRLETDDDPGSATNPDTGAD